MLVAYRVRNLRSLKDSTFLEVRPIVVFVGKNSSGKSTLLRLFPLIKQSVSEDTREPILWYGRSADFGSFDEAISRFADDKEIALEFKFQMTNASGSEVLISEGGERLFLHTGAPSRFFTTDDPTIVDMSLIVARRAQSQGTYTKAIEVRIGSDLLRLSSDESGEVQTPFFNGQPVSGAPPARFRFARGRIFPVLMHTRESDSSDELKRQQMSLLGEGPYYESLVEKLKPYFHGNTQRSTLRKFASRIYFGPREHFTKHFETLLQSSKSKLKGPALGLSYQDESLRAAVLLRHVQRMFREASSQLTNLGSGVRYLEPVRARAARYYRFQELAIDEIDPQGENVPMFLSSLSLKERASLEEWMTSVLGFRVRATKEGGHAKLFVSEAGGLGETNLADTGFGYSQVLPIILQLWRAESESFPSNSRRRGRQQVIAVEQPELHLHPQFQALLADIFAQSVNAAKKSSTNLSLVIETHSEHLINRLGALVEKGTISKDDVVIYLIDRESASEPAIVKKTTFTEAGSLGDPWPFGFFSPQLP